MHTVALIFHIIGWIIAVVSVGIFLFKMTIVYDVAGDPLGGGGVPTLDGVIFPPIFGLLAIRLIRLPSLSQHHHSDHWTFWTWLGLWFAMTAAATLIFVIVDRFGARQLEKNTRLFEENLAASRKVEFSE